MGNAKNLFKGLAVAALLLAASVSAVKADVLTPTGGSTQFTDAQFSPVSFDGEQTITPGGADDVLGCPSSGTSCPDSGTVDILFNGSGVADGLLVKGTKFWVDITGNLSSIFTSYTASGVAVTGTATSITTGLGGQACFESNIGPTPLPTAHGIADAVCTSGSQSSSFFLTMVAPDTFSASNGSIGVTFSLTGSPTSTPEPASFGMLLMGLVGLGLFSIRRNGALNRS